MARDWLRLEARVDGEGSADGPPAPNNGIALLLELLADEHGQERSEDVVDRRTAELGLQVLLL